MAEWFEQEANNGDDNEKPTSADHSLVSVYVYPLLEGSTGAGVAVVVVVVGSLSTDPSTG